MAATVNKRTRPRNKLLRPRAVNDPHHSAKTNDATAPRVWTGVPEFFYSLNADDIERVGRQHNDHQRRADAIILF